jgi:hypothetical protein
MEAAYRRRVKTSSGSPQNQTLSLWSMIAMTFSPL